MNPSSPRIRVPCCVFGTQPFSASSANRVHASRRLMPSAAVQQDTGLDPRHNAPRQGRVIVSLDPKSILDSLSPYGEIGLIVMIFAETGLLIGFFLPGDSLMFTAGLLASQGSLNLAVVLIGCFVAAVLGDQVGFTIGEIVGP